MALAGNSDEDSPFCRICHEVADQKSGGTLLEPCACSGSMRHVHSRCLEAWRRHATNPSTCGICKAEYQLPEGLARTVARNRHKDSGPITFLLMGAAALVLCGLDALRFARRASKEEAARRAWRRQQRRLFATLGARQPPAALAIQAGVGGHIMLSAWRNAHSRRPWQ